MLSSSMVEAMAEATIGVAVEVIIEAAAEVITRAAVEAKAGVRVDHINHLSLLMTTIMYSTMTLVLLSTHSSTIYWPISKMI